MAKRIKAIHDQIKLLTAKGRTAYFPASQIDTAVFMASKWLYNEYYKMYEVDNQLSDSMDVFLSDPITLTLTSGKYTLPEDFMHEIGEITANSRPVKRLAHAQLSKRMVSAIVPPTSSYPVCVFYKTYIQFQPTNITNVVMTYLKKPIAPRYATTVINGREVYDDANSIDIEWNDNDIVKITSRALSVLGVNLDNNLLIAYSENKENKDE